MSDDSAQRLSPATTPVPIDIPAIYFNGFDIRIGLGDVNIVLYNRGVPIAVLESSFTTAKTMAEGLGTLIAQFEHATGNMIMTTAFVEEKLKAVLSANQTSD